MPFDADAFISYAHLDDQELIEGQKGWISNFHRALDIRVGQLLGGPAAIWGTPTSRAATTSRTSSSSASAASPSSCRS